MEVCRVAIAGYGGVGRAIAALLFERQQRYRSLYDMDVRLVAVCTSRTGLADSRGLAPWQLERLERDRTGIGLIEEGSADTLIEAGPSDYTTGEPGSAYIHQALGWGCDVIAISKAALALEGPSLRTAATDAGRSILVSGACGAALPALELVQQTTLGARIDLIEAILNATTNYLLDAMATKGVDFEAALLAAQAEGVVEGDPSNDVDGLDAAAKLAILATFGLSADVRLSDIAVSGIRHITRTQMQDWRNEGLTPKLIARLEATGQGYRGSVEVRPIQAHDSLASVSGTAKALRITTDSLGRLFAVASAAEPMATAAAALKDLERVLGCRRASRDGSAAPPD